MIISNTHNSSHACVVTSSLSENHYGILGIIKKPIHMAHRKKKQKKSVADSVAPITMRIRTTFTHS